MNTEQSVVRDERTVAVENASFRWAFNFVVFALLVDVVCRGAFFHEAAWDLFALACVPGIVCTIYQARHKIWGRGFPWKTMLIGGFVAAIVGAVVAVVLTMTRVM
jgi:hypothetical protein